MIFPSIPLPHAALVEQFKGECEAAIAGIQRYRPDLSRGQLLELAQKTSQTSALSAVEVLDLWRQLAVNGEPFSFEGS